MDEDKLNIRRKLFKIKNYLNHLAELNNTKVELLSDKECNENKQKITSISNEIRMTQKQIDMLIDELSNNDIKKR